MDGQTYATLERHVSDQKTFSEDEDHTNSGMLFHKDVATY